eukprot:362386-Chlamydomonas_euryale.AAC.4
MHGITACAVIFRLLGRGPTRACHVLNVVSSARGRRFRFACAAYKLAQLIIMCHLAYSVQPCRTPIWYIPHGKPQLYYMVNHSYTTTTPKARFRAELETQREETDGCYSGEQRLRAEQESRGMELEYEGRIQP